MKKFFTIFFVTLGVVFFVIILVGVSMFFFDPLGIKSSLIDNSETTNPQNVDVTKDKNPALSPTQEKALETFGIDPATVPTSITPEQEACFVEKLGQERVNEIKAGDSPTATEFFKAKSCI